MPAFAVLPALGISLLILSALGVTQLAVSNNMTIFSLQGNPHFDYVLTIILENQGLNDTYGAHCNGNCTYITQLANTYGLAENYSDIGHTSLPRSEERRVGKEGRCR